MEHTSNTFDFDSPLYHVALALDYLYSMGEAEESQVNNLLENYTMDTPLHVLLAPLSPSANELKASVSMPST